MNLQMSFSLSSALNSTQCSTSMQSVSNLRSLELSGGVNCFRLWMMTSGRCGGGGMRVSMRDRSKNRKPLQRGRNLSIEAIQAVQALKRAKTDEELLQRAFDSRFRRLLKFDMVAVLREFLRQNESDLALKVFEDIRMEFWYKPQLLLFADIISALARNGLYEQVEYVYSCLKSDAHRIEGTVEMFNSLLKVLAGSKVEGLALDGFYLMKLVGREPERSTFRVLINGLEVDGETNESAVLRQEAKKYYGECLEFLKEEEPVPVSRRF